MSYQWGGNLHDVWNAQKCYSLDRYIPPKFFFFLTLSRVTVHAQDHGMVRRREGIHSPDPLASSACPSYCAKKQPSDSASGASMLGSENPREIHSRVVWKKWKRGAGQMKYPIPVSFQGQSDRTRAQNIQSDWTLCASFLLHCYSASDVEPRWVWERETERQWAHRACHAGAVDHKMPQIWHGNTHLLRRVTVWHQMPFIFQN